MSCPKHAKRENRVVFFSIKLLVTILGVIFLVVGVPIIINELYKSNSGYRTVWNAADVLSYYGALCGLGVTIVTVGLTLSFTYKQLKRDSFLEKSNRKWNRIEELAVQALKEIDPLKMVKTNSDEKSTEAQLRQLLSNLQDYSINSMTTITMIMCYGGKGDYPEFENFVQEFQKYVFCVQQLERRVENEVKLLLKICITNGALQSQDFEKHQNILGEIISDVTYEHCHGYLNLLELKKKTFDAIYEKVENDANRIVFQSKR